MDKCKETDLVLFVFVLNLAQHHIAMSSKACDLSSEQCKILQQLIDSIPLIILKVANKDYDEIFGYRIAEDGEEYVEKDIRDEILLKFLIGNKYDLSSTINNLVEVLNWRCKFLPLSAAYNEKFPDDLNKLGVITVSLNETIANYKVGTWNLYGQVVLPKLLFQNYGEDNDDDSDRKRDSDQKRDSVFLRWRVGLMEKSLLFLDYQDPNNSKIVQIHDYNNFSMFRIDKNMRSSTKEIIEIFSQNYPELLSTKFFINVPTIMSWVFGFFSTIGVISKETLDKFKPMNHGNLSQWLNQELPTPYGGNSTKLIYDLDKSTNAKIPTYGKIILEKFSAKIIDEINLSVE